MNAQAERKTGGGDDGEQQVRVIGVDPDSKAHGLAVYEDGKLVKLQQETLVSMSTGGWFDGWADLWVIEDVKANKFIYARNTKKGALGLSIAQDIGKVKQSQIELERFLDFKSQKVKLIKPQKGNWAKNKKQFEQVTGWAKRSNEDTRSAAFFGYLGLKHAVQNN